MVDPQRGEETCRTARRQNVIRSCQIIAEGCGRKRTDEDGTGIADAPRPRPRTIDDQFEMFGCNLVCQPDRLFHVTHDNNGTTALQNPLDITMARQELQLPGQFGLDRQCQRAGRGQQDGTFVSTAVLCLRDQIGSDECRIRCAVGNHENLTRSGHTVDIHRAVHELLRCLHPGIPRANDLVDSRDSTRAVRQSRHSLRAADLVDGVDSGNRSGSQNSGYY